MHGYHIEQTIDSLSFWVQFYVKFIYSEKATKFCEISTEDLPYVVPVKPTMEIFQTFVAFSEYMNFKRQKQKQRIMFCNFCSIYIS